jgi:outer membrane murein-binding lipoprotein Lpp
MTTTTEITAENSSLFEIDKELEATFDAAAQEQEQSGTISEETRLRCTNLFAELGKKVDRIARYVRATEFKARAAEEEAARLTARQKSADNRVEQVKSMLSFFMQSRGLKRLEGKLNTIRLQRNGQASLRLNPLEVPGEYNQATITLMQQDWLRLLNSIASPELKQTLEGAVTKLELNKDLIRQHLQTGKQVSGATLLKGDHVRFD